MKNMKKTASSLIGVCAVFSSSVLGCGSDSGTDGAAGAGTGGSAGTGGAAAGTGGAAAGTGGATGGVGGTGGGGAGTGGTGGSMGSMNMMPADSMFPSIAAFLESEGYKTTGWVPDGAMPRDGTPTSPHGRVIVYLNDIAVASKTAMDAPLAFDSMAVKEFYDDGGLVVGRAAMWKTQENTTTNDRPAWTFYCVGPMGRCYTNSEEYTAAAPVYSQGAMPFGECSGCHGGLIYTDPP
jgi:hypothetical protein